MRRWNAMMRVYCALGVRQRCGRLLRIPLALTPMGGGAHGPAPAVRSAHCLAVCSVSASVLARGCLFIW
jgi:hypothetical protein